MDSQWEVYLLSAIGSDVGCRSLLKAGADADAKDTDGITGRPLLLIAHIIRDVACTKLGTGFGKGFSIDFGVFYTFLAGMDSFGVWIRKPSLNTPMYNCPSSFPSPLIPIFSSYSLNLLRLLFLLFLLLFLYMYFHLFLLIITRQWHSQEFMMGSYWYVFYVIKIHFHVKYSK